MKITIDQAQRLGERFGIDFRVVPPHVIRQGMLVELEHGRVHAISNITNNNLEMTFKIVLAHLLEFPDYYARLERMEQAGDAYWRTHMMPSIFL